MRPLRVIVAGGGLAGLTAARDLVAHGVDVRLIDARERLGGRVWTRRDADGVHAEAGGDLIDASHRAVRALASSLDLPLVRVLRAGFGLIGRVGTRTFVRASGFAQWQVLAAAVADVADAYRHAGAAWDSAAAAAIARAPLARFVPRRMQPRLARAFAEGLRGFYLAEPETVSALAVVDQVVSGQAPGREPTFRVRGGNDRLVEALGATLRGRIETGTALRAVQQTGHGVRATVERRGRRHQMAADLLVVTLPPPLVREVRFDPPLPAAQVRALTTIGTGPATKAALRFARPWWRRRGRPRAYGSNLPCGAIWEAGEDQDVPVLTFLGGGSASRTLAALAREPGRLTRMLTPLGRPLPGTAIGPAVTWEDEPWSRGGYAVFTTAFDPRDRRWLGASHGRVLFAGEHTSERWQGFMNGAVESGARAAREVEALSRLRNLGLGRGDR